MKARDLFILMICANCVYDSFWAVLKLFAGIHTFDFWVTGGIIIEILFSVACYFYFSERE